MRKTGWSLLIFASAMLAPALVGCRQSGLVEFHTESSRYLIPESHVRSVERGPHTFIRVKNPEVSFELVYDSRLQSRRAPGGAPLLFSINDGDYRRILYRRSPGGRLVVCRIASAAPRGGCGMPLFHGGGTWTVLFPDGQLAQTDAIRSAATDLLAHYRR